jgi:hypothetical protein
VQLTAAMRKGKARQGFVQRRQCGYSPIVISLNQGENAARHLKAFSYIF